MDLLTSEVPATTDSKSSPVVGEPRRIGAGCLAWTARLPAVACLIALAGSVLDYVGHGPVPPREAAVVALLAAAGTAGFVYYGALIETAFSPPRALRAMPRVFLLDVVLFAVVAFLSLLSQAGGRDFGGGDGGGGPRSSGFRSNFASGLVDPVEFAAILGARQVEAKADGFDTPMGSLARIIATDEKGKTRARLWLHVYQQRAAGQHWLRAIRTAQPVAGPGDAAVRSGDRLTFKSGDTVVDLRLSGNRNGLAPPDLGSLAAAVNRRLQQ